MIRTLTTLVVLLSAVTGLSAGNPPEWERPEQAEFPVVQGRGWTRELGGSYRRLPDRAEVLVPPAVWKLSAHSAGEALHFVTNSPEIRVRYGVQGPVDMSHMPATGVSGIDLYQIDNDGTWLFVPRLIDETFSDTVSYRFCPVPGEGYDRLGYEFRLYLPLYNEVEWIEVGIDSAARFEWLPLREERPVVAYGTSILQGGCASRPGMAWTNILSRKIDRTVMNFGFSGSGRMERETVELIAENDAKAWIIDCVPNMNHLEDSLFEARYLEGVRLIRMELKSRGVADEHIEAAVENLEGEEETAKRLLEKYMRGKPCDKQTLYKAFRYLIGKGFEYETAKNALSDFGETDEE